MDILFPQILFYAINFTVVVVALSFLLYKPLLKIFADRAKRIEEGQVAAQEAIDNQAQIALLQAETKKELEKKSAKVMEQAVKEAEIEKQRIMAQAHDDAALLLASLQSKWDADQSARVRTMNEELINAVVTATEQIIQVKLTKQEQSTLVEKELSQAIKWLKA